MRTATAILLLWSCRTTLGAAEVCDRPPKPSADSYTALGVGLARHQRYSCSFQAFENALQLAPGRWLTHYDYALALKAAGLPDKSIEELRQVTTLNPEFLDGHLALSDALKAKGSLEEAARELNAALGIDQNSLPANEGLAQIFMAQRRFSAAIPYLRQPAKRQPNVSRYQLDLAVAEAESGDDPASRQVLKTLLAKMPNLAEAHYNLAVIMAKENEFREAAAEYRACLRLDPANNAARFALAVVLHKIADDHSALPYAEEYAKLQPNDPRGFALLGKLYRLTEHTEEAEKALLRAVELAPADAEVRLDLGITLAQRHLLLPARDQLEKARALNPQAEDVHFRLANLYKDLNETDQWQRELGEVERLKARKMSEDLGASLATRANRLLASGDARAALDLYRQSLQDDPGNAKTYYNLSIALRTIGDAAGEREALKRSIELNGNLAPAHDRMGILYQQGGQIDEALAEFQAAMAAEPQAAEPPYNLALVYALRGQNALAENCFRRAIENDPDYLDAHLMLAKVIAAQGRLSEAEKPAETALHLAPRNPAALTLLGMIRTRLGHGDTALPLFRQTVALAPADPEAHLNLGIALADVLNPEAAITEFAEAVRLAPQNAAAHYNLGRALFDVQRIPEAQPELERALEMQPNYPSTLYLLGLIERQQGNLPRAVERFRAVIAIDASDAAAHFQLGRCLKALGQDQSAISEWRTTLQLKPDDKEAEYNLARALGETAPQEAHALRETIANEQNRQMDIDRASTLGNFALTSASQRDWPQAVAHFKEALQACGACTLQAQLRKDLGLTYARSGNLRDALAELRQAEGLAPRDQDIKKSIRVVQAASEPPPVAVPSRE